MDLEVKKKVEVKRNYIPVNLQLFAEGPEDDEPLPQTSDPISWAGGILGLGSLLMLISKKKDA